MLNCHYFFRNSLCLILILSLILLPTGCGEKSENTDSSISIGTSNEADSSLSSNAEDASLQQGTETPEGAEVIEDKFVMLREVYDILSGPLGESYRTPEYLSLIHIFSSIVLKPLQLFQSIPTVWILP